MTAVPIGLRLMGLSLVQKRSSSSLNGGREPHEAEVELRWDGSVFAESERCIIRRPLCRGPLRTDPATRKIGPISDGVSWDMRSQGHQAVSAGWSGGRGQGPHKRRERPRCWLTQLRASIAAGPGHLAQKRRSAREPRRPATSHSGRPHGPWPDQIDPSVAHGPMPAMKESRRFAPCQGNDLPSTRCAASERPQRKDRPEPRTRCRPEASPHGFPSWLPTRQWPGSRDRSLSVWQRVSHATVDPSCPADRLFPPTGPGGIGFARSRRPPLPRRQKAC